MIASFPVNQRDEIHHAYLRRGPYQPILKTYPLSNGAHHLRFQVSWYELYLT